MEKSPPSEDKKLDSSTVVKYVTLGVYTVIIAIILGIYHQAQTSTVQLAVLQVSFESLKKNIEDAILDVKEDKAEVWRALNKLDERIDEMEKLK